MIEYSVYELDEFWGALELEEALNHCAADDWLLDSLVRQNLLVFVRSADGP